MTALTRSADKAKKFESLGVKAVVGSLDDLHTLETIAAESDVVIECVGSLQPLFRRGRRLTSMSVGRCGSFRVNQGASSRSEEEVRLIEQSTHPHPYGMFTCTGMRHIIPY